MECDDDIRHLFGGGSRAGTGTYYAKLMDMSVVYDVSIYNMQLMRAHIVLHELFPRLKFGIVCGIPTMADNPHVQSIFP